MDTREDVAVEAFTLAPETSNPAHTAALDANA
jgi:hypothetical protein